MNRYQIVWACIAVALAGGGGCAHRSGPSRASAARGSLTTLDVNGDIVTIVRDDFGVPHIFAKTNRALFQGYGYAVAQDRLWQLELFRRAAYGTLSEVLGPTSPVTNMGVAATGMPPPALALDTQVRTSGYTGAE